MRRIADDILMASSLLAFQLISFKLLSDSGLLVKLPLEVRMAILDGRSLDKRFKKLLFWMFRRGVFSLSGRERVVEGGGARGELLVFFDRNPVLNLLLFF